MQQFSGHERVLLQRKLTRLKEVGRNLVLQQMKDFNTPDYSWLDYKFTPDYDTKMAPAIQNMALPYETNSELKRYKDIVSQHYTEEYLDM